MKRFPRSPSTLIEATVYTDLLNNHKPLPDPPYPP
jgi:hypothetical protein